MNITTTRFGEIEVQEDRVFDFVMPFIGYDQYKKYVLLEHNQNSNFRWVQSTEMPELAFAVASAALLKLLYLTTLTKASICLKSIFPPNPFPVTVPLTNRPFH